MVTLIERATSLPDGAAAVTHDGSWWSDSDDDDDDMEFCMARIADHNEFGVEIRRRNGAHPVWNTLLSVDACIVAADGSRQRVVRALPTAKEVARVQLATVEELRRPGCALRAADGSLTVVCALTVLRHHSVRFVDLCRPGQLQHAHRDDLTVNRDEFQTSTKAAGRSPGTSDGDSDSDQGKQWPSKPSNQQVLARVIVETVKQRSVFPINYFQLFSSKSKLFNGIYVYRGPDGAVLFQFALQLDDNKVEVVCYSFSSLLTVAHYTASIFDEKGLCRKTVDHLSVGNRRCWLINSTDLDNDEPLLSDENWTIEFTVSTIHRDAACVEAGSLGGGRDRAGRPAVHFPPPGLFSDITLRADGRAYPAHRAVLADESPVFRAMFNASGMKEDTERIVDIEDIEADVIGCMIKFLYTEEAPCVDVLAADLLVAADKYELDGLKLVAEDALASGLNADNAVDVFLLAERRSLRRLRKSAISWIGRHFDDVLGREDCRAAGRDDESLRRLLEAIKEIGRRGDNQTAVDGLVTSEGFAWLEAHSPRLAVDALKRMMVRPPWCKRDDELDLIKIFVDLFGE